MRRREFLWTPMTLAGRPPGPFGVKALAFDVFGTVVDWRGSVIREGAAWGRAKSLQVDWAKFADRWRAGYGPSMDKVRRGALPWMKLDALHRIILNDLLQAFGVTGLTEAEKDHWNRVWHRLTPWPDAVEGLACLKEKYVLATLSNGNVSLLAEMAKSAGLPWDVVLSAELFHHYKPGSRGLSGRGGPSRMQACGADDGGGSPRRLAGGPFVRSPYGFRAASAGVRSGGQDGCAGWRAVRPIRYSRPRFSGAGGEAGIMRGFTPQRVAQHP